jgi:hypothetical protein
MKTILSIITVAMIGFTASSCSHCDTCSKTGDPTFKLCEKDFDSNTAFNTAKAAYVAQGYDCR